MRYLIVFSLAILFFASCSKTTKKYYDTGELKTELYKDNNGLRQGEVINYYKNGQIESKGYCVNDTFNGKYEEYYPNGQLKIKTTLVKGIQNGEFLEYFDNGMLNERSNYVNGKENGLFTFYYKNGKVESKITMKDGYRIYSILYDSLGNETGVKYSMEIYLKNPVTTKDTIKVKEFVHGFFADEKNPMFALIEKYGTIKEGEVAKMKFNLVDSSYYISFLPQKDTGKYLVSTFCFAYNKFGNNKYKNQSDTIITIN